MLKQLTVLVVIITGFYYYFEKTASPLTGCQGRGEVFLAYLVIGVVVFSPIVLVAGNLRLRREKMYLDANLDRSYQYDPSE